MPPGIGGAVAATGGGSGFAAALGGPVGIGLMAISGLASLFGGGAKKREAYRARLERDRLKGELSVLEKNRQAIINPYAGGNRYFFYGKRFKWYGFKSICKSWCCHSSSRYAN